MASGSSSAWVCPITTLSSAAMACSLRPFGGPLSFSRQIVRASGTDGRENGTSGTGGRPGRTAGAPDGRTAGAPGGRPGRHGRCGRGDARAVRAGSGLGYAGEDDEVGEGE